jgi:hypothetical protein
MNKKIIMPIALLTLLSLAVFVYADMDSGLVVRTEKGTTYDFVYGCEPEQGCIEYPGIRTHFKLYPGWNIVPNFGEGAASPRTSCLDNEYDFATSFLKYRYYYFPGTGYIGGKISGNNDDFVDASVQSKFIEQIQSLGTDMEDVLSLQLMGSHWIYSEKSCDFELATKFYRDLDSQKKFISNIKLKKGWNFVYLNPIFLNSNLKDNIGNCQIEKANTWSPITQGWNLNAQDSVSRVNDLLNTQITEENVYMPLLLRVTDDCNFGPSASAPPELP